MEKTSDETRLLSLSIHLYRSLLAVYPSEFQRAYGGPMLQVFRDCCLQALSESGHHRLLALWIRTIFDTVQTAIEEHSQRGVEMTKEKFYKLSGWAMTIGPVLFLIGIWASTLPKYSPYNAALTPINRYEKAAAAPLVFFGLLFISLGILGMLLRYSPRLDGAGISLGVAAFAGLVSAVGVTLELASNYESNVYIVFILGLVIQYTAFVVFGIISMRRRLLPRWNGLPLLAAWIPPGVIILSLEITPWDASSQVWTVLWILTCGMFAGLGYLLQSDEQTVASPAAA
jgi:hypothetical protein